MIVEVISQAPVAQLDRARASDARCRKFESCQVHFLYSKIIKGDAYGVEEPERIIADVQKVHDHRYGCFCNSSSTEMLQREQQVQRMRQRRKTRMS